MFAMMMRNPAQLMFFFTSEIENFKPHVVYQLLEEFHYATAYDQHIASFLELMKIPYTGCNPRGLILARGKDLSKTLVHHRRIAVPAFAVFPRRRKVNPNNWPEILEPLSDTYTGEPFIGPWA